MSAAPTDFARKVTETAGRLRMVQISFADESDEKRQEYIAEVLDRALESVLPDRRREFLSAVQDCFPLWETKLEAPAPPAPEPATAEPEPPEAVIDRFLELAKGMGGQQRKALLARLKEAGLAPAPAPAPAPRPAGPTPETAAEIVLPEETQEALQYLMHKLGIAKLDLTRAVKLLVLLVEHMHVEDQLMWNTWRTIAPRSGVRRPCELAAEMGRFAGADREVSALDIKNHVEALRRLTASVIAGMGQAGTQFARNYLAKFTPQEIEAQVMLEGGGLLSSKEYKCWNRYVEMAPELTEQSIEHAIRETIAKYTESLMKKSGG